jgi:hypothetical protein
LAVVGPTGGRADQVGVVVCHTLDEYAGGGGGRVEPEGGQPAVAALYRPAVQQLDGHVPDQVQRTKNKREGRRLLLLAPAFGETPD